VTTREDMIDSIVEAEWKMFQDVPNIGGRAACQDDLKTFRIMRAGQSASWSDAMLESYLDDLNDAKRSGRNLLTEKYARMMRSTSPSEYARIEHLLQPIDPEAIELIDQIVKIVLEWEQELLEKYPYIVKRGRPLFSREDSIGVTSMETYLRGELSSSMDMIHWKRRTKRLDRAFKNRRPLKNAPFCPIFRRRQRLRLNKIEHFSKVSIGSGIFITYILFNWTLSHMD
jgi:hypothetical protein